jgi:hypothetical protein
MITSQAQSTWLVYRRSGTRLEYIDKVQALDAADAARKAVDKHHDWRNDGMSWDVAVIPAEIITNVRVHYEPVATVAA